MLANNNKRRLVIAMIVLVVLGSLSGTSYHFDPTKLPGREISTFRSPTSYLLQIRKSSGDAFYGLLQLVVLYDQLTPLRPTSSVADVIIQISHSISKR
jgi:hypothetical protein